MGITILFFIVPEPDAIDPVYLALKQATTKYGNPAGLANRPAGQINYKNIF